MAPTYAMSCLVCGTPLADDGSCPKCGAGSAPPSIPDAQVSRERAQVQSPPGGALVPGRIDRLGVFQAAGQRTNWFVRIAALVAAAIFALAVAVVIVAALVGLVSGVWILPTGGLGALLGTVIVLISLLVLLVIGVMVWLLVRRDQGPPTGSYGQRRI
jgi:hypothetical protein